MALILEFAILAAILGAIGFLCAIVWRKFPSKSYRAGVAIALGGAFLLFWINAAVGIVGDTNNDANMLYVGVIGLGVVGTAIARLRPNGMALTLVAMAVAMIAIAGYAMISNTATSGPIWPRDVIGATAFFAALFLVSAWMFRKSERELT